MNITDHAPQPDPSPCLQSATASGRPEIIGYTLSGAPLWLLPLGAIVDDIPIPWLDAAGNEVFDDEPLPHPDCEVCRSIQTFDLDGCPIDAEGNRLV